MLAKNRPFSGVSRDAFARAAAWAVALSCGFLEAGQPAARPRPVIVDSAVVPAGGLPCPHCRPDAGPPSAHHPAECRDGLCAPHCPVRPSQYGFYSTQWRRWPGQGVVPTSAEERATPVQPPASQVPTVDQESPLPPVDMPEPPGDEPAGLPTEPIPQGAEEADPAAPAGADEALPPARVVPPDGPPVPPTPPGEPPLPPETGASTPEPEDRAAAVQPVEEPMESGSMRYPATVGRSVAAGSAPWRLQPAVRQRAADSARGL